jgi:hypothetical protein
MRLSAWWLVMAMAASLFPSGNPIPDTVKNTKTARLAEPPISRIEGLVSAADTVNRRIIIQVKKALDTLHVEGTTQIVRGVMKIPLSALLPRESVVCSYETRQGKKFALRIASRHTGIPSPARPSRPQVNGPAVPGVKGKNSR